MGLKLLVPAKSPGHIPKINLGLPALPFSYTGAFEQVKLKPEGGAIKDVMGKRIVRAGQGVVDVASKQTSTKRYRNNAFKRVQSTKTGLPKSKNKRKNGQKKGSNTPIAKKKH